MAADRRILLCCDLDRTVVPNGGAPEDPKARALFAAVAARDEVILTYVSGRSRELQRQAIACYGLPQPDLAVADVGTTIYEVEGDDWRLLEAWHLEIAPDWAGRRRQDIESLVGEVNGLRLQEAEQQSRFKLSFFADTVDDPEALREPIRRRLDEAGVRASFVWSIDEAEGVGLLDVLPQRATKAHAVQFLRRRLRMPRRRTVFAGDSGNDLPALTSGLQAVLVANARDDVRSQAVQRAPGSDVLYLARGGFLGMNGNYAAGVLEGLAHFIPETEAWMRDAL
jgi:sucrose-6F-phosphate phosphohydrolase